MAEAHRPLALVTGASTGIGYQLALECARNGFDLVVAADEARIWDAAADFRAAGAATVEPVQADRSRRCWPMPAGASSTRISTPSAASSTPTS